MDLSSILESFTSVINTVINGDFNIQINNENHASLSLNKLIFDYFLTQYAFFTNKLLVITLIVIILTFFYI